MDGNNGAALAAQAQDSPETTVAAFLESLPVLSKDMVDIGDSCPICLTSFDVLTDPSAPNFGVTKLNCGHIFCRQEYAASFFSPE
jgi:hypothetical protein